MFNLALITAEGSARPRFFERAIALYDQALGPAHPVSLSLQRSYGQFADDPDRSRALIQPACEARERYHPEQVNSLAWCLYWPGQIYIELGYTDQAIVTFAQTAQTISTTQPNKNPLADLYRLARGFQLLAADDPRTATDWFGAIVQARRADASLPWWVKDRLAQALMGLGLSHAGANNHREAITHFEGALTTFDEVTPFTFRVDVPRFRNRTRVALAKALWLADQEGSSAPQTPSRTARARAIELMTQAEA